MKTPVTTAPSKLSAALKLPPKWLQIYDSFITTNQSAVTTIESTLQSFKYIIPGRFRDAELASESLHSSIQLLSLYHDKILLCYNSRQPRNLTEQSLHNRYTRFWYQRSVFYRRAALLLYVIQYTKLLWEMLAKRRGEKVRWRIVLTIEILEAVCRLSLLRVTNSRSLINPPFPKREVNSQEDSFPSEAREISTNNLSETEHLTNHKEYHLKRTGMTLSTLPDPQNISNYLLSRVLTPDDIKAPNMLLNQLPRSAYLAEILYILQPVIIAINVSLKGNKKSWQPWILGLSIEYMIRALRKNHNSKANALEKIEWKKRNWAMAWWVMRSGFYENFTKKILHRVLNNTPSFLAGILDDYLYLWDEYYFSTSF